MAFAFEHLREALRSSEHVFWQYYPEKKWMSGLCIQPSVYDLAGQLNRMDVHSGAVYHLTVLLTILQSPTSNQTLLRPQLESWREQVLNFLHKSQPRLPTGHVKKINLPDNTFYNREIDEKYWQYIGEHSVTPYGDYTSKWRAVYPSTTAYGDLTRPPMPDWRTTFVHPGMWWRDRLVLASWAEIEGNQHYAFLTVSKQHVPNGPATHANFDYLTAFTPYLQDIVKQAQQEENTTGVETWGWDPYMLQLLDSLPEFKQFKDAVTKSKNEHNKQADKNYEDWLKKIREKYPCYDPDKTDFENFMCGVESGMGQFGSVLGGLASGVVRELEGVVSAALPTILPYIIIGGVAMVYIVRKV